MIVRYNTKPIETNVIGQHTIIQSNCTAVRSRLLPGVGGKWSASQKRNSKIIAVLIFTEIEVLINGCVPAIHSSIPATTEERIIQ